MDDFDYGTARSGFLEEVRTVLSRAETALDKIIGNNQLRRYYSVYPESIWSETEFTERRWTDRYGEEHVSRHPKYLGMTEGEWVDHPGLDKAVKALEDVIRELKPFEKKGRRKRR